MQPFDDSFKHVMPNALEQNRCFQVVLNSGDIRRRRRSRRNEKNDMHTFIDRLKRASYLPKDSKSLTSLNRLIKKMAPSSSSCFFPFRVYRNEQLVKHTNTNLIGCNKSFKAQDAQDIIAVGCDVK